MKKILSLLFATLLAFTSTACFADDSNQKYGHDGQEAEDCAQALTEYPKSKYLITDFDLTINIAEDNRYKVTEEYDVCFANTGSHGIYRDIPYIKDFWRENGDVTKDVKMQVTNVEVIGDDFKKSREDENIHLKIGNANRTLKRGDSKHYIITYDYNFGPDNLDGVDEFYYNIIGSEWASDVIFLNTDFEINFPKDIEESKIGFTHGYVKKSLSGGTPFELKNNKTIEGHYYDSLKGGEALTIRVTLPEGYIQNAAYDTNTDALIIFASISAVILVIVILNFFKFSKGKKLPLYTRYDPPEGMNPVQFGSLVNASSSTNVTSLFYYLAEQGFLQIEETSKNKFDIVILKGYNGKDRASRVFMETLKSFDRGKNGRVSVSSLKNHFYTKIWRINEAAGVEKLREKIYTKSSNTYRAFSFLLLAVYIFASALFVIMDPYADPDSLVGVMLLLFFFVPGVAIAICGLKQLIKGESIVAGIILLIFGSFFGLFPLQLILFMNLRFEPVQSMEIAVAAITSFLIAICAANGKKYTEEGRKIMTDVLSYYKTIKSCRPDAMHGFSYFYYTFAFAFSAGLSTAFSRKFKEAISQPPEWYHGTSSFTHFNTSSFASSMNSISSSSSSSPSSSGGGSSGGGSSGGGGGGGGGGGW